MSKPHMGPGDNLIWGQNLIWDFQQLPKQNASYSFQLVIIWLFKCDGFLLLRIDDLSSWSHPISKRKWLHFDINLRQNGEAEHGLIYFWIVRALLLMSYDSGPHF